MSSAKERAISTYEKIMSNHGVQTKSGTTGNSGAANSGTSTELIQNPQNRAESVYNRIMKNAEARKKKSATASGLQNAYNNTYNALVEKVGAGDYDSKEIGKQTEMLLGMYDQVWGYEGNAQIKSGLESIQKELSRAKTSSGILPEEAEAMRTEKAGYESQATENSQALQQAYDALDAMIYNKPPSAYQDDPAYLELIERIDNLEKTGTALKEQAETVGAELNIYDRTNGFQAEKVDPLKDKDGFYTARADYAAGAEEREAAKTENSKALQQAYDELDALIYNKSPSAYQDDPAYLELIERIEKLEKETPQADDLGEYLDWYNALDTDTQERLLEGRFNAQDPKNHEIVMSTPSTISKHWERMTEDEINAYYYIANTEGVAAAKEFLDDLQVTLDKRHTEGREQATVEQMEESPTWANALRGAATFGANAVGGTFAFASDVWRAANGEDFNPYSNAHYLQNITGVTRSAAASDIQETIAGDGESTFWNGVGEVAANAYQAALSSLDSVVGMYTMGNLYTVTMGMGAASSRMRELYESGATDKEIYVGAIGSGILEALFEKVSLEYFTNDFIKANPEKWVKKALLQAGVEGSEEFFTEISNLILDAANRGVNSDHNQRVRELMADPENPMSQEEAEKTAVTEDAMDVFWAFFGGVLSGGMSAVGGAMIDSNRQNAMGQEILERGTQQDILSEAQELRKGDTLAQDLESKQKEGTLGKNTGLLRGIQDSKDATRLGRVYEQNVADMVAKDTATVTNAVAARLAEERGIRNPEATAEAMVKQLSGEDLSMLDRYYLFVNEDAADFVRDEINSVADGDTAANAWWRNIKTHANGGVELNSQKAAREAMETVAKETFGPYSDMILQMYRPGQSRTEYMAEVQQVYQAGMDGKDLESVPETKHLAEWQRAAAFDMGQGKSEYDYDNNQEFAAIKGETVPINIVGVAEAGNGNLILRTDDGTEVQAKDVVFGGYSQSKIYSVINAMGVDTDTANQILDMSKDSSLDLNEFSRAMQDAFFAGRSGVPFSDISKDRYAMKLTEEERKLAWKAGRKAARARTAQKSQKIQQRRHSKAKGGITMEGSARNIQNLNSQQQAAMDAAQVLAGLGLDITVYASTEEQRANGMENGNIRLSDGSIRLDLNAGESGEGVMAWALSHEFTHFVEEMSPEKFQTLQDVLFQELGKDNQDVMEMIEEKVAFLKGQKAYQDMTESKLWELATSEVVAEMMEPMLTDTDAISRVSNELKRQDESLWGKIKDWITGLVEKLKAAYKDLTPGSTIAQQTRNVVTQSEEILNAWVDAASDAIVNYNLQEGQKNNAPEGVRYSKRSLSDQIDEIANQTFDAQNHVYYGTTPRALSNILSIPIMPMLGTYTHAYTMALDAKQAANEGRKTKGLNFHGLGWDTVKAIPEMLNRPVAVIKSNTDVNDSRFVVVTNAMDGAGNPIIAALTPKGTGNYYDLDITSTVLLSGYGKNNLQNYLARAKSENRILWVNKKNHQKQASPGVQFPNALLSGDYTSNLAQFKQIVKNEFAGTVFQNTFDENGDRLFSSRNVQQTKNLVALHNITEEKFLKTLELGGFPMPSIAITKADIPHTNFGDITVVFGRETIDPKSSKKNTVYSADAWTPTVPQVEYEADSKATSRVYKQLTGLQKQVDEWFRSELGRATYDIEGSMNRYGGEEGVVQAALENYGVKAAYLEEQGQHITPETKQETVGTPVSAEMQDRYVKIMDILGVDTPEQIGQLILKEVREQHGAELEAAYPGVTKSALRLGGMLNRLKAWLQGDNGVETRTVTDVTATRNAVDSAIDPAKFEAWVRNLYQGVEKSSGVYNGKPRFTEAGNSRTFKQTHLPATLEGIVKAMAAQNNGNTKNVSGFNGVKTLRAGTAERFSSIADMHKMEGRLQNLTQAQQDEIHDSLSTRLYDVIKEIDEEAGSKLGGSNSLVRYDTIGEVLMEIAESGSYNVADIQRVFQQYGKTISDETAIAAKELLFDVSQMPVNIFEAKPERAVGFEEIKTVLVPDTASQKLLQELDSRGIPYQTYQAGNDEQRHQMVQDMEDIRFSQRTMTQLEREKAVNEAVKAYREQQNVTNEEIQQLKDAYGDEFLDVMGDLLEERVVDKNGKQRKLSPQQIKKRLRESAIETGVSTEEAAAKAVAYESFLEQYFKNAELKEMKETLERLKKEKKEWKKVSTAAFKTVKELRRLAVENYRRQESAADQQMKELYERQYRLVMKDYQKQLETMEGSEETSGKVEAWRKTEERGKLQKTLNTLNKMMLNPTKTAFVPDSLQPAVIHAMDAMNNYRLNEKVDMDRIRSLRNELDKLLMEGATKNQKRIRQINRELDRLEGNTGSVKDTLTELKRMYAELLDANEGKVAQIYDEGVEGFIADALDAIGDTDYSDLSIQQLQALNDAYTAILHRVRTANKTFASGQQQEISQLADKTGAEFRRQKDRAKLMGENVTAVEKFGWNNLKPVYAFERMGSQTMATLYDNLRNGEDTFYRDIVDARAWALACMEKYGYSKWKDQVIEYESKDGKTFGLNLEERMSLYAYSRRRQALEHLMDGGIVLNENTKRMAKNALGIQVEKVFHDYNNYPLTLETIQAIGESLTKEQKAFAEEMQQYLSTVCADKNNEISRALYGVSTAKEKYYWPLKVSNLFSERVRNQQQNQSNRRKNAGHMKATTPHANNPVEIAGFMDTWGNHVNNTAMYHAFTLPMEDFLRVYNFNTHAGATDESIIQLITQKHGKGATEYIDQLLKDLNQGVRADPRESIASSLTSKFKKAKVSASLSVAIQQPSAIGRAFAVIDPKYFNLADMRYYGTSLAEGLTGGKVAKKTQALWEKMKKYAPVVGIKEIGRFDVNMGASTVDFITGSGETGFMAGVDKFSGLLPEKMDQATWMMIWNAAERQCKAQGYTGENLNVATAKLFTEAITKTQVYDSVFSRSGNMRSKSSGLVMATAFMAEPTTTANMALSAMADIRNKNFKSGGRKMASIFTATVINSVFASLVYASRDDDEDSPWKEKYLKSLVAEEIDALNVFTYVPYVKDVYSILQGYDVERTDMSLVSEGITILNKLGSLYEKKAELDKDDANYEENLKAVDDELVESWWNAAGAIGNGVGLPLQNFVREVRAVINTVITVMENREMDSTTAKYAMWEAAMDSLPTVIRDTDGTYEELYKAMTSGSKVWVNRMRNHYDNDEDKFQSAVKKALRQEDKRIRTAAKALLSNSDSSEYKSIVEEIVEEGHFTEEQVKNAIESEATSLNGVFSGYQSSTVEKFVDLYENNLLDAEQYTAFLEYRDAEDADGKKLHSKDEMIVYIGSMKVNTKAKDALYNLMGYAEKELSNMPWNKSGYSIWEARVDYPALADYSDGAVETFLELRNSQITVTVFTNAYEYRNAKNSEGKQLHTPEEIMAYIDSLNLSRENKDELYLAMGYKETTLNKTPWN